MKNFIAPLLLLVSASTAFSANDNQFIDIPTDGWVFTDSSQCLGEPLSVDSGQSVKVRLRVKGEPTDPRFTVSNRSTTKLYATGEDTGYRYLVHQVWSPISLPGLPGDFATQLSYNEGRGAGTFLLKFNIASPGSPELGHLIIHEIGHLVFNGGDPLDFRFTKESFSIDCVGPGY